MISALSTCLGQASRTIGKLHAFLQDRSYWIDIAESAARHRSRRSDAQYDIGQVLRFAPAKAPRSTEQRRRGPERRQARHDSESLSMRRTLSSWRSWFKLSRRSLREASCLCRLSRSPLRSPNRSFRCPTSSAKPREEFVLRSFSATRADCSRCLFLLQLNRQLHPIRGYSYSHLVRRLIDLSLHVLNGFE